MNTENRHNYYEILDLKESASQQEIYDAYIKAKMTYSVENKSLYSVFSNDEAVALRRMIEEAYEVLSNNTYRNIYEKRVLAAKNSADLDLSIESIKSAGADMFQRAKLPEIKVEAPIAASVEIDEEFEKEISTKKEWSGDDLKKVREYKKLSFDELTDITKINPWYISALEKMDPSGLPVEVFVRGYVIQVAKALGLNEKTVADSYMRIFRKKIGK